MAKQILKGKVISNKMQKTVVVEIVRRISHPLYKKYIKVSSKIKADTGEFSLQEGDVVVIESTRPISRTKYFKVIKKVEDGRSTETIEEVIEKVTPKKGGRKASK